MADSRQSGGPKWFVGFDCATKTFAYSVGYVDPAGYRAARDRLRRQSKAIGELIRRVEDAESNSRQSDSRQSDSRQSDSRQSADTTLASIHSIQLALDKLAAETSTFIQIRGGATVDLFPGRPDKDISTVERVRAVSRYVRDTVRPAIRAAMDGGSAAMDGGPARNEELGIVVEFQMGQNPAARAVAVAVLTLFAEENVFIVGPSLKNKVYTCDAGRYGYFAEKYASAYGANKAHTMFNFAHLEQAFGTAIPATKPASLRGHIADSFMQIIGHLVYGQNETKDPALQF